MGYRLGKPNKQTKTKQTENQANKQTQKENSTNPTNKHERFVAVTK
jgi:hypothetical protein